MTSTLFYNLHQKLFKACLLLIVASFVWSAWIAVAAAATLSVSPGTAVQGLGTTFTARVVVNTGGEAINAVDGTLRFDKDKLSVVALSKGSIFGMWPVEPSFSNSAGTVTFSGGSPAGYTGSAGTVLSVTFRTKTAGAAKVSFTNGSVLANDGRGTNVLSNMSGGSYTVAAPSTTPEPEVIEYVAPANTPAAPRISSATHQSDGWSRETAAELSWTVPADVTAMRTLLDKSSASVPTKLYESPINSITLNDLEEGVQYFHLQFKNAEGWGRVTHYRLAVDTTDPSSFTAALLDGADVSSPRQSVVLTGEDAGSGIVRYEVQLDGGEPFTFVPESASSTLELSDLAPGKHTVVVEAFDAAGNSVVDTLSFVIVSFERPEFTDMPERISAGVVPAFSGYTRPGAVVTVQLQKVGTEAIELTATSDNEGKFTVIPGEPLATGVYDLSATAIDQYGAASESSDIIRFVVEQPGYLVIGTIMLSVMSVVVPLAALVVLLVLGALYLVRRLRSVTIGVTREAEEALAMVDEQFLTLQQTVHDEAEALAATRKTKKLTKAEQQLVAAVEAALHEAQNSITREVQDVDDIVE